MTTRARLEPAIVSGDIATLLQHARGAVGVAARRHARDLLESALQSADPGAVTRAQRIAARRLGVDESVCDAPEITVPPHAVLVPMVLEPLGVGVVRYLRVAFDASTHNGYDLALDATAARAVSDALQLATTRLGRSAVDRAYCLTTVHPDAFAASAYGVQLQGPSLGAAAFVSAMSLWSERPVLAGTVVTGKLVGESVREVGGIDEKLRAAVIGRPDVQRIIVPQQSLAHAKRTLRARESKAIVVGVSDVDALIAAALDAAPQRTVSLRHRLATLRLEFDQGWQGFGWANVREHAERVLSATAEQNVDLKVDVMTMLGAAEDHLGSPLRSLQILERALDMARTEQGLRWVPDLALSRLHQRLAMTQRRLCRFREARQSAARATKLAERGRHREELYKAYGCAGLVELAAGKPVRAMTALEQSLALNHAHAPETCVRSHAYLIEAYARAGDRKRSEAEWNEAMAHAQRNANDAQRPMTEAWLRTSRATALWTLGESAEVIATLDVACVRDAIAHAPLPGLLARRYLGLAWIDHGAVREGQVLLAASDVAYGPTLGTNLSLGAQLNVLCEAWGLLSHGVWDSDIAGRAQRALQRYPDHLRQGRLERLRTQALRELATGTTPKRTTGEILRNLIDITARIA